jgi:putative hydrolase of the HAD superfamily
LSQGEIERRTAEALRLDARRSAELWEDVWTEYLGTLNEELLKFVSALRPRYKTAILSNSFVGAREREQEHYRFQDHFDAILYSHEEGIEKPHRDLYMLACDRLGVLPREAVFVDDLAENVEGAENLGMKGLLFISTDQVMSDLHRLGFDP